jgi:hypothetical protein
VAPRPKQAAISALFLAALDAPSRVDTAAFDEFQARVMEPLREAIRNS